MLGRSDSMKDVLARSPLSPTKTRWKGELIFRQHKWRKRDNNHDVRLFLPELFYRNFFYQNLRIFFVRQLVTHWSAGSNFVCMSPAPVFCVGPSGPMQPVSYVVSQHAPVTIVTPQWHTSRNLSNKI